LRALLWGTTRLAMIERRFRTEPPLYSQRRTARMNDRIGWRAHQAALDPRGKHGRRPTARERRHLQRRFARELGTRP
jgi:hypothetical protein